MTRETGGWRGEFDYLRGIAILAIVWIHVGAFANTIGYPNMITPVNDYLTHLADFGVPLFFFISGYVLTWRYFQVDKVASFYRRRLAFIVPPYLAFTAVYGIYNIMFLGFTPLRAVLSFVLFDAAGPFWFIAIIIQLYLLFPFLARWYARLEGRNRGWRLALYSFILYVAWWGVLRSAVASLLASLGGSAVPDLGNIVADRLFPGYLIFFALGIFACRNTALTSFWYRTLSRAVLLPAALLMAVGLQFLSAGFWWDMLVLAFCLVMFALLARASLWLLTRRGALSRTLHALGVYSYGIYLIHVLVIAVVVNRLWTAGLGAPDAVFYLILYPATVLLSFLALWVINRVLPFGYYITGVKAKKKAALPEASSRPAQGRS